MAFGEVMTAPKSPQLGQSIDIDKIRYDVRGVVPIAIQDILNGAILELAGMDREAVAKTLETGKIWLRGESGPEMWHPDLAVCEIGYDRRGEALVIGVDPTGTEFAATSGHTLAGLFETICDRRDRPNEKSYTCQLFAGGDNKILKKIGEESAEVVMACKDDDPEAIASEVADLFYHTLVALAYHGVDLRLVYQKLEERRR
jgi:phosphoribosyl-ATP pyrophosphohydrolase/phosphoribosyl-AMP cyclohydrolase